MSRLIIWDKIIESLLPDLVTKGCDVVFDEDNEGCEKKDYNVLSLRKLFKNLSSKSFQQYEAIIILVELDWRGKYLQDFYGMELAKKFRIEYSILCPIIMCSTLSEKFLLDIPILSLDFYKTPGVYYLNLCDIEELDEVLKDTEFIDEETLLDISESFVEHKDIISNAIHDLKNKRYEFLNPLSEEQVGKIVEEQFKRLTLFFKAFESTIKLLKNVFVNEIGKGKTNKDVEKAIAHLESELNKLVPEYSPDTLKQYKANWKILFLDDEENIRNEVKAEFEKRGLKCDTASNRDELYDFLKNDESLNHYTVLICDYRLKEYGKEKYSHKQGYSILKEVYLKKPNYLSLFALSSMNNKALLRFRERYNMKVWTFSKDDVREKAGFNIFCEKVFEEGEKMFGTICNLPGKEYKAWCTSDVNKRVEPFNMFYRAFRMSEDFEDEEKSIGEKAKKIFYERISEKNSYDENFKGIIPHEYDFQAGLNKGVSNDKDMIKFKQKLIGRRLYLALRFKGKIFDKNDDSIIIPGKKILAALLHRDPKRENKVLSKFDTGFFTSMLCMPEDLDKKPVLLTEESHWLKNDLKYELDKVNRETYNEILDIILDSWDSEIDSFQVLEEKFNEIDWVKNKNKIKSKIQNFFNEKESKAYLEYENFVDFKHRYATSGVFDLLRKYNVAPKEEIASRSKTIIKNTAKKKKADSIYSDDEQQENLIDVDPSSPEGQTQINEIDPNVNINFNESDDADS